MQPELNQIFAGLRATLAKQNQEIDRLSREMAMYRERPRSPLDEINSIPGRRLFFCPTKTQDFTATQDGQKGAALSYTVSQDGPFIMTHFPLAMWKVTAPTGATNFGVWRPVSTFPLPTQHLAYTSGDLLDLSYELVDSGPQQNFQDNPLPPLFSRPDNLLPLPCPTKFAPASVIAFTPTYENILFNTTGTATTGGRLVVTLIGFRISNRE